MHLQPKKQPGLTPPTEIHPRPAAWAPGNRQLVPPLHCKASAATVEVVVSLARTPGHSGQTPWARYDPSTCSLFLLTHFPHSYLDQNRTLCLFLSMKTLCPRHHSFYFVWKCVECLFLSFNHTLAVETSCMVACRVSRLWIRLIAR